MSPKWFDHHNFKSQLWKNGQGETLELFRLVNPGDSNNFLFRLSIATVKSSGPFSQYPGIDRHLILIKGQHLLLKRESGNVTKVEPFNVFSFKGEELISSEISSVCQDFNIMTDRSWGRSEARVIKIKRGNNLVVPDNSYLYQLEGNLKYRENVHEMKLWQMEKSIEVESMTDSTSILVTCYLS